MTKPLPTSIRLPAILKDRLKEEAARRKWAVSKLIEEILKGWYDRRKGKSL